MVTVFPHFEWRFSSLQDLHHTYYEPLSRVASSIEEILEGPPAKKLLFMTDPSIVDGQLRPYWTVCLPSR